MQKSILELRGVPFLRVWQMSGATGFFGEGYPFHRIWKHCGMDWRDTCFVAKTTTYDARVGNMPLKEDGISPQEYRPKCIVVKFRQGVVLNAVGLSGPGAHALVTSGRWQHNRGEPFWISFMPVAETTKERCQELTSFVALLSYRLWEFSTTFGLQINLSCPNIGIKPATLLDEAKKMLTIAGKLSIPITLKLNLLVPPRLAAEIAEHPDCDAIHVSNSLPWGSLPERINWKTLFGSDASPLAHLGGGGLSGRPLLPLLIEWLKETRPLIQKPIIAGGGILSESDAEAVIDLGADAIALGVVGILRPWRMRGIVEMSHRHYKTILSGGYNNV